MSLMHKMANQEVFLLLCASLALGCWATTDDFLEHLVKLRESEQATQDRPYRGNGQWHEVEGIYKTYFFLGFHGGPREAEARHNSFIPETDSFTNLYTTAILFEAQKFGGAPLAKKIEVDRLIRMLGRFHDKNRPNETEINFHMQIYDEEEKVWHPQVENLYKPFAKYDESPDDLATLFLGPDVSGNIGSAFSPRALRRNKNVPADFDSSSVHLGLSSHLYRARDTYPEAWQAWQNDNQHIEGMFQSIKKYAYRPFSDDPDKNSIDARSYYFLRDFLDQAKRDGKDLALLTLYAQSIDELREEVNDGIITPFAVPMIDMAVGSNFMSGTILGIYSGLIDPEVVAKDTDVQLVINSTASLIIHELQTNFSNRPDLSMPWYPSLMQTYWLVSRGLMHMETARQKGPLLDVLENYYQELKVVMATVATEAIVESKQEDPCGGYFYDGFVGTDDLTADGQPLNRAEDRVYTTSMATNALLYTWTIYDEGLQTLTWRASVPQDVKNVIKGGALWLRRNTLSGEYLLTNPFFSASCRGLETTPYLYPANRFEYLNGTTIPDRTYLPPELMIYAMEGYVQPSDYDSMLAEERFGYHTPRTYEGINAGHGTISLWSCEALTQTSVTLAVSMADRLED